MGNIGTTGRPAQLPVHPHGRFRIPRSAFRILNAKRRPQDMLAALLVLAISLPAFAQDAKKKDNDPNITVTPGWNLYYRPGKWMPLYFQVKIENPTDPAYEAVMAVTCQQDNITKMNVQKPVLVTKDLPLEISMVVKTAGNPNSIDIEAQMRQAGSVRWETNVAVNRGLIPLKPQDMLVALVKGTGLSSVPQMRERTEPTEEDSDTGRQPTPAPTKKGQVAVASQFLDKLPDDWAAYDAVDLLVLQDVNWGQMSFLKQRAIAQWVRRGGKLLIVLGTNPMPEGHQLGALLPFKIGTLQTQTIRREQLQDWKLSTPGLPARMTTTWKSDETQLPCWDLTGAAAAGWDKACFLAANGSRGDVPWAVNGLVGFGQVGVVAFNPDALTTTTGDALPIWQRVFNSFVLPGQQSPRQSPDQQMVTHGSLDHTATNTVVGHLLAIPELRPLSIWWVIGLLSALAVLLGPVDYFVLKKLDRLPWTWITSTVIIVLFSVGAWYGVQKIRGGTLQVRVVSVLDGIQGQDTQGSANYYGGIFAPDSDYYRLDDQTRKERDKNETQWWSAISPDQNLGFDATSSLTSRNVDCKQTDDGNLVDGVPINIWSMQCLLNEAQDVRLPLQVRMETAPARDERGAIIADHPVKVIVTNLSDKEVVGGEFRAYGNMGFIFGRIPPNGTEVFEKPLEKLPAWQGMQSSEGTFAPETAYFAEGTLERTRAIEQMLFRGAAVVSVRYNQAAVPFEVAKRNNDLAHIQMVRMVVWPTATAG